MSKLLATLLYPLPVSLLLIAGGLIGLLFRRQERLSKSLVILAFSLLALAGTSFVSESLLHPLEYRHSPFQPGTNTASIRYIVVLGGGIRWDPTLPLTTQITPTPMIRLLEGIHLYGEIPGSKLVLSGASPYKISDAEMMAQMAKTLGIPSKDMVLETKSSNTYEEALFLKPLLQDSPFLLVTSARHMPRSMALFQKQGLHPIAAPTNYLTPAKKEFPLDGWIPSSKYLSLTTEALYEYDGLLKEWALGHLSRSEPK